MGAATMSLPRRNGTVTTAVPANSTHNTTISVRRRRPDRASSATADIRATCASSDASGDGPVSGPKRPS